MSKKKKILRIILIIVLVLVGVVIYKVTSMLGYFNPGNKGYDIETVETISSSPLKDKKIIFLGSSVTEGMQAKKLSFVDYLSKKDDFDYIKEAVSGTTLVDNGKKSYVQRLINNIDTQYNADLFVCQLSTNDAQKKLDVGKISQSKNMNDFDTQTITGAMEYIIAYAKDTWDVPVVFYTGTQFESAEYEKMIKVLYQLQDKWGIYIIDLWKELPVDEVSKELYTEYMNDDIHPTRKGYLEWWGPQIEKELSEIIEEPHSS